MRHVVSSSLQNQILCKSFSENLAHCKKFGSKSEEISKLNQNLILTFYQIPPEESILTPQSKKLLVESGNQLHCFENRHHKQNLKVQDMRFTLSILAC